jgi:hypothetical protein
MNKPNQVPRRLPDKRKVIQYKFPRTAPIFWGPGQKIKEDNVYVEPSDWIDNETLIPPKVVRFIHDAHEEQVNAPSLQCHLSRVEEWIFIGRVEEVPYSAGNPGDYWPGTPIVYGMVRPFSPVWDQLVPIYNGAVEVYKVPILIPWNVGHARISARNYKFFWANQENVEFAVTEFIDQGEDTSSPPLFWYPQDVPSRPFPVCPRDFPPVCPCQP